MTSSKNSNENSSFAADEDKIDINEVINEITSPGVREDKNENPEYSDKSITKDELIISITEQMNIANNNFTKRDTIIDLDDKKTLTLAKSVLKDVYNNTQLMKKKINNKNEMDENDRIDLKKQYEFLKILNNICNNIYDKYQRKNKTNPKQ